LTVSKNPFSFHILILSLQKRKKEEKILSAYIPSLPFGREDQDPSLILPLLLGGKIKIPSISFPSFGGRGLRRRRDFFLLKIMWRNRAQGLTNFYIIV